METDEGLAVNAAVSMRGDAEGTQHSETAGAGAVILLKACLTTLAGATVPGTWDTSPDRAPEG